MRISSVVLLIAGSVVLCADGVMAEQSHSFSSMSEAQSAFKTNKNHGVRMSAYGYVCTRLNEVKNTDAGAWVLPVARTMAHSLGRKDDSEKICRMSLSSTNRFVRVTAATFLCDDMRKLAFPESERALRIFYSEVGEDAALQSVVLAQLMSVYKSVNRIEEAVVSAESVLAIGSGATFSSRLSASCTVAEAAVKKGDAALAGSVLCEMLRQRTDIPSALAQNIIKMKLPPKETLLLVECMREKIATSAIEGNLSVFVSMAEKGGVEIVRLLRHAGKYEEALSECRILTMLSKGPAYRDAVMIASEILKDIDGDLGRAGRCIEFYRKNAVPGTKNELLNFPVLVDSSRRKLLEKLDQTPVVDWKNGLNRWRLYIWADSPQKSLQASLSAFATAPMTQKDLQSCANAAQWPILSLSRDPALARKVVSYLMLGCAGVDGIKGTSDDIEHPAVGLEAYMKLCGRHEVRTGK